MLYYSKQEVRSRKQEICNKKQVNLTNAYITVLFTCFLPLNKRKRSLRKFSNVIDSVIRLIRIIRRENIFIPSNS